jgi:hypothetical protein
MFTDGIVPALTEDNPTIASRTFEEFEVELAGLLCRLGLDESGEIVLQGRSTHGVIRVQGLLDGDLILSFHTTAEVAPALLEARGWTATGSQWIAQYEAPLAMVQPAGLICDTLARDLGCTSLEDVAVTFEESLFS